MSLFRKLSFVCFALAVFWTPVVISEPWMSIRSSQNCAGCHSPGRKNVEPKDRRCTLTCQGCHVSPSGGGMRNHNGRWFSSHWLKSFSIEKLGHDRAMAPSEDQLYDQVGDFLFETKNKRTASKKIPERILKRFERKKRDHAAKGSGIRLKRLKKYYQSDLLQNRDDGREHDTAKTEAEFWVQVPEHDPLRQRLYTRVDGGGSFRYQLVGVPSLELNGMDIDSPDTEAFLMSADIGARWRPAKKHLNLVFEHRVLGSPNENSFTDLLAQSKPRSMYVLIDDLPYNSYLQAGAYKFGFGRNSPDHTLLSQELLARSTAASKGYNMNYQAISVGAAPNIPFAHLHYIHKDVSQPNSPGEKWSGFAGQIGAKTILFGSAASYSFLHLKQKANSGDNSTQAHAIHLGGMLKPKLKGRTFRLLGQIEATHLRKERAAIGSVPAVSAKATAVGVNILAQIWREIYLNGQYGFSDTNRSMQNGSSNQWRVGIKAHLLPGLELSMRYGGDTETTDAFNGRPFSELKSTSFMQQLHFYF